MHRVIILAVGDEWAAISANQEKKIKKLLADAHRVHILSHIKLLNEADCMGMLSFTDWFPEFLKDTCYDVLTQQLDSEECQIMERSHHFSWENAVDSASNTQQEFWQFILFLEDCEFSFQAEIIPEWRTFTSSPHMPGREIAACDFTEVEENWKHLVNWYHRLGVHSTRRSEM